MKSYAQDKEDLIIADILPMNQIKNGRYIDVGANDPDEISVTKAFYEMGWSGINIEPLPDKWQRLHDERPRDINIRAGLGREVGHATLYVNGSGSSYNSETINSKGFTYTDTIRTSIYTLSLIYDRFAYDLKDIHFCKIDVEGDEREVLLGVDDWEKFRPWLFVMESTYAGTEIPCYEKWENILTDNGYVLKTAHGINRYYIDSRREWNE